VLVLVVVAGAMYQTTNHRHRHLQRRHLNHRGDYYRLKMFRQKVHY
jgi:hypothetical protein